MAFNRKTDIENLHQLQNQGKKFMELVEVVAEQSASWPDLVYTNMCTSLQSAYQSVVSSYQTFNDQREQTALPSAVSGVAHQSSLPETGDGLPDDQPQASPPAKGGKRGAKQPNKGAGGKKTKTAQEKKIEERIRNHKDKIKELQQKKTAKTPPRTPKRPPPRCNDCTACKTEDCRECTSCLDMPKFGGKGGWWTSEGWRNSCDNRPPCTVKGKRKAAVQGPSTSGASQVESTVTARPATAKGQKEGISPPIKFQGVCQGFGVLGNYWLPLGSYLQARENSGNSFHLTRGVIKIPKTSFYNLTISGEVEGDGEAALYAFLVDPTTKDKKSLLHSLDFKTKESDDSAKSTKSKLCFLDAGDCFEIRVRSWSGYPVLACLSLDIVEEVA